MGKLIRFIKNWTLPISIVMGVVLYFVYVNIHALDGTHEFMNHFINFAQPLLIFVMLFLSFCKVNMRELRPHRWQLKLLAIQAFSFIGLAIPIMIFPQMQGRVIIESAMLCMICPTATAAAVVTNKLHGNMNAVVSYTCIDNLMAAILIPAVVSVLHSTTNDIGLVTSFTIIIGKVFPLLILPLMLAFAVKYLAPKVHAFMARISYISFYLWAVALTLAIGITTKAMVHSHETTGNYIGIALVSIVCCILQFVCGRIIGRHHREPVAGAQSLGQKNTAFCIWIGYTFMSPVTALAGGFYAVWHNLVNTYQLYVERKRNDTTNISQNK